MSIIARNTLQLSILIGGKVDKSLTASISTAQSLMTDFAKGLSKVGDFGIKAMAAGVTAAVAGIVKCTDAAKEFEADMANVVKYVDGLADKTGQISNTKWRVVEGGNGKTYAENYKAMSDAILTLSTQIPYTAEELTQLAAAAGQSGKSIDELIQYDKDGNIQGFLKDVAMLGTAWDVSADQAGDWAAKWEVAFKMNHDEVMTLADQINYLGANNATTAAEIADVVNKVAAFGETAGFDPDQTAALSTALLAMGVSGDKAATSISRLYTNLNLGSSASKVQMDMWESLGLTSEGVAKSMQENATETMQDIFSRINAKLPEEKQVAALKTLFGQWSIQAAAKLKENPQAFEQALAMVQDSSSYTGSMLREFNVKSGTLEALEILLGNSINKFEVDAGDELLDPRKQIVQTLKDFIDELSEMPELTEVAQMIADLFSDGVKWAGEALKEAMPKIKDALSYIKDNGPEIVDNLKKLFGVFVGMKFSPQILQLLSGGASLFSGVTSSAGGILSGAAGLFSKVSSNEFLQTSAANPGFFSSAVSGKLNEMFHLDSIKDYVNNVSGAAGAFTSAFSLQDTSSKENLSDIAKFGPFKIDSNANAKFTDTFFTTPSGNSSNTFDVTSVSPWANKGDKRGNVDSLGGNGNFLTRAFSSVKTFLSQGGMNNVVSSGANFITTAGQPLLNLLGGIGGILAKVLPVLGIISGVIAAVSLLGDVFSDNMENIREWIGKTFGEKGLAIFDKVMEVINNVGEVIKDIFGGNLISYLDPVVEFITKTFGEDAGDAFTGLIEIIQSVLTFIKDFVDFSITYVKPILEDVIDIVIHNILPIVLRLFAKIAPILARIIKHVGDIAIKLMQFLMPVIERLLPPLETLIDTVLRVVDAVLPPLLEVIDWLLEKIGELLDFLEPIINEWLDYCLEQIDVFVAGISEYVDALITYWSGVIEFFQGVFTGDWDKAWGGIEKIFEGAWNGISTVAETAVNFLITKVNSLIDVLNKFADFGNILTTVFGGNTAKIIEKLTGFKLEWGNVEHIQYVSVPKYDQVFGAKNAGAIAQYANGSDILAQYAKGGFTSGPSIAGEDGTEAVISFKSSERLRNLNIWQRAGKMLGVQELKEISSDALRGNSYQADTASFSPTINITIQGGADEAAMQKASQEMLSQLDAWYERKLRTQARRAY